MDTDTDNNAAPSSAERVLLYLESRVPDCDLTILSRALLTNSLGEAKEAHGLLALSSMDLAHRGKQCSAEAEPEWEHVGILDVELRRDWLLYETPVAQLYLDLFCERGPTRPPESFGRVFVPAVKGVMWPAWIRILSSPAFTDRGLLEAMPDGLSRPCYPCEEPPYRHHFVDVTLRTRLLQVARAVKVVLRFACATIVFLIVRVALCPLVRLLLASLNIVQYPFQDELLFWLLFHSFLVDAVERNFKGIFKWETKLLKWSIGLL